ncbi:MAG: S8 family serine peptidase [Kiritimatiellae bacterium]|nr:S8 family serine peptidase [Kiritimatiellia bacterium]
MTSQKNKVLLGALLAVLVLLVALIFHARHGIRQIDEQLEQVDEQLGKAHARLERPIPVRLANRTLEIEASSPFPKVFAQHQTPSARGTLPYLVICAEPVSKVAREQVAACGAHVLGVVSARVLLVETDETSLAKIATNETFAGACELMPPDKVSAELASAAGEVDVTLVPLAAADVPAVSNAVVAVGGRIFATPAGRVRAHILAGQAGELAARGDVRWIERYAPAKLLNDVAVNPGLLNVRKAWAAPHGLTGAGQIITIADTGLDTGITNTVMADFQGRVNLIRTMNGAYNRDIKGHGTHVAGSLAGDGALSDGNIRGVAYATTLNVWQIWGYDGSLHFPDTLDEMFRPDQTNFPSYIFSGSWGYVGLDGVYTDCSSQYDDWIWRHPDTLVVLAAGNNCNQKVVDPGSAKNPLCVGAS